MATIDGIAQKRVTLTTNIETIVVFDKRVQNVSFMAEGGTVYFKENGTITGNTDLSANYINDGNSFDLYKGSQINELHLYSTSAATVQWDIP